MLSSEKKYPVVCFGEILWDILPNNIVPGGAPMNVAYHLRKLGIPSALISRVGLDNYGKKLIQLVLEILAQMVGQDRVRMPGIGGDLDRPVFRQPLGHEQIQAAGHRKNIDGPNVCSLQWPSLGCHSLHCSERAWRHRRQRCRQKRSRPNPLHYNHSLLVCRKTPG